MLNHIKADIYRISKKKSLYFMLFLFSAGFITMSIAVKENNFYSLILLIISLSPVLIGIYVFSTIYGDDLKAHSMQTAIGFGTKRSTLVLTKFIEAVILLFFFHLYALAHVFLVDFFLGYHLGMSIFKDLFIQLVVNFIAILALYGLSSNLIFTTQKSIISIVAYLLLALGVVDQILQLILSLPLIVKIVGNLQKFLLTTAQANLYSGIIQGADIIMPLTIILVYIFGGIALSVFLFDRVELDF